MVKLPALNLQLSQKIKSTTSIFQRKLQKKEYEFWNPMYITLFKVYCSPFLAVSACTFNWPMIDILRNKDESLKWTVPAFKCDQSKRKGNMDGKYSVEVHNGKYST